MKIPENLIPSGTVWVGNEAWYYDTQYESNNLYLWVKVLPSKYYCIYNLKKHPWLLNFDSVPKHTHLGWSLPEGTPVVDYVCKVSTYSGDKEFSTILEKPPGLYMCSSGVVFIATKTCALWYLGYLSENKTYFAITGPIDAPLDEAVPVVPVSIKLSL